MSSHHPKKDDQKDKSEQECIVSQTQAIPEVSFEKLEKEQTEETISLYQKEIELLKSELDVANKKLQEQTNIALRTLADWQNYRRRTEEEKTAFKAFATSMIILEILPTADNLNRAQKTIPDEQKDLKQGIEQIEKGLLTVLQKYGVKQIESLGKPFDASFHEAIMETQGEKGIIIEELEKGYFLNDKVLRPAKVKVGKGI